MSLFLSENKNLFFGRSSIWRSNNDTDFTNFQGNYFPKKLLMSLTSICNLSCQHCWRSHSSLVPGMHMSKERLDQIIQDFFHRVSAIHIGGTDLGEQMCSPLFDYFLQMVSQYPVPVEMITNGTLINKNNAKQIATVLSQISISIEGIGKNYESIRGHKWDDLVKKIELLVEEREKSQKENPLIICLQLCVLREYITDYFELISYAKAMKIDLIVARNFLPMSKEELKSSLLYFEKEHNTFFKQLEHHADEYGVPIVCPPPIPLKKIQQSGYVRKLCCLPFEVFGIQTDGKIVPCCDDSFELGYYMSGYDNIMQTWKSDRFVNLRKTVNSDKPLLQCYLCEVVNYNALIYRPDFRNKYWKALKLFSQGQFSYLLKKSANKIGSYF